MKTFLIGVIVFPFWILFLMGLLAIYGFYRLGEFVMGRSNE